jgi:TrmH family RNA methyltransferase
MGMGMSMMMMMMMTSMEMSGGAMTYTRLTGKDNLLLKTLRKLSRNPEDDSGGRMAIEGVRILEEAENSSCAIEAVVITENFGKEPREKKLLDRWQTRGIRVFQVNENLFASISAVRTPQGAMALARTPRHILGEIKPKEPALILCASGIQDPGNLGTLIRTGAAAGADMALTTTGTVSARNPKTLRASAGAFFNIPVIEHLEIAELYSYCGRNRIHMYRTDARAGVSHTQADLVSSCAIFLGNEGAGVNRVYADLPAIHIPMPGNTESLNVAAAGAILLFEAARQRSGL